MTFAAEVHPKVFLRSSGCSSNVADGEFMMGCLLEAGYEIVEIPENADVLIFNTCAVKTPTENRVVEALKKARGLKDKKLIVSGCLPLINFQRLDAEVSFDGVLGAGSPGRIAEAVKKVASDERIVWLKGQESKPCLDLPKQPVNPVVSIVPVSYGCLGSCSYCCVASARGRLRSCRVDEVVGRVKRDLDSGAKEVWLTGQDMACYGRDIGVKLPSLLDNVCGIKGDFWIRAGMMTPDLVLDMLPELVKSFKNDHVFKFVHLPVQSGDNEVLRRMNRRYSVEDFRRIVEAFRRAIPEITVATDVICGFPGESAVAFEHTLELVEEIKPNVVNVSKFFPRPKTAAEKMTPKVPASEVKERSRRMTGLVRKTSFERNRAWQGWKGCVLIDEIGKQPSTLVGRNFAYKPIVVKCRDKRLLGKSVTVLVVRAFQTYLEAETVD